MRRLLGAACAVVALVLVVSAPRLGAAPTDSGTQLFPGWTILDATVTGPASTPRHLNSAHAAAFVQAWFPATILGTLQEQHAPARLPVFKVVVNETVNGAPYKFIAYYASDDKTAWAGMPVQTFGPGAFVPKEKWFRAPARTIAAFAGKLEPLESATPQAPAQAQTRAAPSSGNPVGVLVAIACGAALVVGIAMLIRARGRTGGLRRAEVTAHREG